MQFSSLVKRNLMNVKKRKGTELISFLPFGIVEKLNRKTLYINTFFISQIYTIYNSTKSL